MSLSNEYLRAGHTVTHPSFASACLPRQAVVVEVLPTRKARLDNGLCLPVSSLLRIEAGEIWMDVLGYVHRYIISSHGKVVSLLYHGSPRERFLQTLRARTYPGVSLCNGVGVKQTGLARLVAQHFLPPPTDTQFVCAVPKDGNRLNSRAENLQWVNSTAVDDFLAKKYLHRYGEQHAQSKLTAKEVARTRELAATGLSKQQIANEYEVSRPTISQIVSQVARRHD